MIFWYQWYFTYSECLNQGNCHIHCLTYLMLCCGENIFKNVLCWQFSSCNALPLSILIIIYNMLVPFDLYISTFFHSEHYSALCLYEFDILNIACKWGHATFAFLCLTYLFIVMSTRFNYVVINETISFFSACHCLYIVCIFFFYLSADKCLD
jgi:hypothetical protein